MKVHRPLTHVMALPAVAGLCLAASLPAAAQEEVSALIDQLVDVNSPNTFYAGTFRFTEFPPLDEAPLANFPMPDGTATDMAAFRALVRLIELGPDALPGLLAHLDDKRETRTSVPDDLAESMGPSAFVDFRSGNPREEYAIRTAVLPSENPGPDFDGVIEDYTLTVGDMCFTLIGMITNRSYYIVVDEFEPQVNSPTRSPKIVTAVREKWGTEPTASDFYAQLKDDLELGEARFAESAAKRLLYYFPSRSDNLVIAHLAKLIASHRPGSEDLGDYLAAISWSTNPQVMSMLRRFLQSANDPYQLAVAAKVYGSTKDPRGHLQLMTLANKLKLRRDPNYVEASRAILRIALNTFPDLKEKTITQFLDGSGAYAKISACVVCAEMEDPPLAALTPLLANRNVSSGARYLIKGEGAEDWPKDDDYASYRICDRAYETLSRILGDRKTIATGTHAEMDTRIEALAKRLKGKPSGWKFSSSEIKARQKVQNKHLKSAR